MRKSIFAGVALACLAAVAWAQAPVIDGSAGDTLYGGGNDPTNKGALSIQDTVTGFGDASLGRPDVCNGSELDAAYGVVCNGTLYLVLAGNFETNGNKLELFFDTRAGGQNRLLATNPGQPNAGLLRMSDDGSGNGLTFASGFEADFWVSSNAFGNPVGVFVDYAELYVSPQQPGVAYFCGAGTPKCQTNGGALTGGDAGAPVILCTVDNSNVAGVVGGPSGVSDGTGITTGFELAIPLAALGNPTGDIKVCAFINGQQHDFVSNQVLGGLFGSANLGEPRTVDFSTTFHQPFIVPNPGTPAQIGACCVGQTCQVTTQSDCVNVLQGTYLGDNTNCDGNPCDAVAAGRCCIDDGYSGQCLIRTAADCAALGGTYGGDATTCEACPCLLPPKGACCVSGGCELMTEAACTAGGGVYAGDNTNCNTGACDEGACCVALNCTVEFRFACNAAQGRFVGIGTTCDGDPCAHTISTPHVAGDFQGWDPGSDPMTETPPGSFIYTRSYANLGAGGRHEFKITDGTWNNNLPGSNSWLFGDPNGDITITYDANFYSDGWLPNRDRLGLSYEQGTWTATGDFLSELGGSDWNNADPHGAMAAQGGGVYKLHATGIPAGHYNWKAVVTGSWDSISSDARSVNTANMPFVVNAPTDTVDFYVNGLVGTVKVAVTPAGCRGDFNCDGSIGFDDIDPFVDVLSGGACCDPTNYNCDVDGSGGVGFEDIDPFVALLSSGATCP